MYSTVSTSVVPARGRTGSETTGGVEHSADRAGVEVAVVLRQLVPVRELDHAAAVRELDELSAQQPHQPVPRERVPRPVVDARSVLRR